MVNPYAVNASSYRPTPTKQIVLGQSNALKKFEKIQAKHTASLERRSGSPGKNRKNSKYSMDSYGIDDDEIDKSNAIDDDDDDDEDEDSLFVKAKKNANKFMKQKTVETSKPSQNKKSTKKYVEENEELTESQQSDLEISVVDRSSTPLAVKQRQNIRPSSKASSRLGATSAVSSVSSMKSTNKRSQSKVKFMKTGRHNETITDQENEDESTIIEELMNNLLNIDDLEPAIASSSFSKPKTTNRNKFLKSPLKVNTVEEKDEEEFSSITPSIDSPSLSQTNLVDINELEKSLEKVVESQKESKKIVDKSSKDKKKNHEKYYSSDSEKSKKRKKNKKDKKYHSSDSERSKRKGTNKKSKEKRSRTSTIVSMINESETDTIATEIISESFNKSLDSEIKTLNESQSSRTSKTSKTSRTSRSSSRTGYSSSRTPRSTSRGGGSRTDRSTSRSRSRNEKSQFLSSQKSQIKSYNDDFETDQDLTSRRADITDKRKQLSFAADQVFDSIKPSKPLTKSSNAEIQVDTADLLKYSNLLKSVNVYNPSSLLLASVSHFDDNSATLRDLNQLTGYNMINQTFNDLIKYNLNFMKNFLSAQRTLYEQQIQSIQPTYHST